MHPKSQNSSEALNYINKALEHIDKAIRDLEEKGDIETINEFESVRALLEMSQKIIMYGLFHN
ncbi:hypothetical protein [Priestia megaterium]|uniref:hypothetical protein n=1 Tax=Priestia megaterium TaxID=1404 RepID=UPI00204107A9|nr:hypothetical protein [Priestia megaterium]MCM3197178.1 hypothetical protein [Priestia megaterium]